MSDLPPIIHRPRAAQRMTPQEWVTRFAMQGEVSNPQQETESLMSVQITSLGHVAPGGLLTLSDPATYLKALQCFDGLDVTVVITAKHPVKVQP